MSDVRFAFFGTPDISASALDELERAGLVPALVVTSPDTRQGRGMIPKPSPVKEWAQTRGIQVVQPERVDESFIASLRSAPWDVFVVVAYGKILPASLLEIPARGVLNVHPSLLPRFRGPSPVRSAILADERRTGVSVMLLDEKMDHGPIIAQKEVAVEWPPHARALEERLMREGAQLLAQVLPAWLNGEIVAQPQNHDIATYCSKITKEDGYLDLRADPYQNLLKIRALEGWPGTYAFFLRNDTRIRVQIVSAHIEDTALMIDSVRPEGKREMPYKDFLASGATLDI